MKFLALTLSLLTPSSIVEYQPGVRPIVSARVVHWPFASPTFAAVHISGPINEETAGAFEKELNEVLATGQPLIPIIITSFGGSIYSMQRMVGAINRAKARAKIATICHGQCMSAGAMLLMYGTEGLRFADAGSTILLHDISSSTEGKIPDMREDVTQLEALTERLFAVAARQTGHKPDYFLEMLERANHKDIYLTPQQAKAHNIVNHVGWPDFRVQVDVLYDIAYE